MTAWPVLIKLLVLWIMQDYQATSINHDGPGRILAHRRKDTRYGVESFE
jgi:hypothetical protein